MSEVYIYDGSLEGLLSAFSAALEADFNRCVFQAKGQGQRVLPFDVRPVPTSRYTARALWDRLMSCGGPLTLHHVVCVFLSEIKGFESVLYEFMRLTLLRGRSLIGCYSNHSVRCVQAWRRKVLREIHRFIGLLRFVQLKDGTLYAAYEPEYNITFALAHHFVDRLRKERWVIHDRKRELAIAWDGEELRPVTAAPKNIQALLSDDEGGFQRLWQCFVQAASIPERANPLLRQRFMPRRYWKYLTEEQMK
jgi:probable DNA metabolism protein